MCLAIDGVLRPSALTQNVAAIAAAMPGALLPLTEAVSELTQVINYGSCDCDTLRSAYTLRIQSKFFITTQKSLQQFILTRFKPFNANIDTILVHKGIPNGNAAGHVEHRQVARYLLRLQNRGGEKAVNKKDQSLSALLEEASQL
jgi:hypothetical protein